jgi:hypothetical protein
LRPYFIFQSQFGTVRLAPDGNQHALEHRLFVLHFLAFQRGPDAFGRILQTYHLGIEKDFVE